MSKKESVVKSKVIDHFTLVLDTEDGSPAKTWKLVYNYRAIARIEEKIGKDIKNPQAWRDLSSGKDFPVVVWGGLLRHHPEVTVDEVMDVLNPEAQELLSNEIFKLMFPGVAEALEKLAKADGATASPNAQTATPTA